ncbi:unnamed protein product [Rotaria magnacalcarata]|uniref:G-protein coupled receptors family 1 profile domain-containing protein n=1 Tax=Rotaria magnacalcarata TaxID=392030 RepID=A0A815VGS1_9BILA|nr:unnamed protein product [Rotaria magnacalcarata]CAF3892763.1 unnamed protein product [Rotaria magnacalcarata]
MSTNDTSNIVSYSLADSVKFPILIAFEIPSILVSILIFIYFGWNRNTPIKDHNHSILVLLAVNFVQVTTDLPMPMNFFRLDGIVQPATSAYCTWWTWYEFSLNTINGCLMAWISFERHLLIFHSGFLRNIGTKKRRLLRIVPLALCIIWGPIYYCIVVIISPMCENTRYFDSLLCGMPCYLMTSWGTFDLFVDVIFPVFLISLFNLALLVRVINQSLMVVGRVQNNWRKQRKLALQLGMISFVYLAVWIPLSIGQLGQNYIDPNFFRAQSDTFNFLVYLVPLVLPIVCLMSMHEVIIKFKSRLFRRYGAVVMPANDSIGQRQTKSSALARNMISKF